MGIINSFLDWNTARIDKRKADMQAQGLCPDCGGRGFDMAALHPYILYADNIECPGCSGTGQYSDWENN